MDNVEHKQKSGSKVSANEKAEILESATKKAVVELFGETRAEERFLSYISMHEFEALLYSEPAVLANEIGVEKNEIENILAEYQQNPEEINQDPELAPSKRLLALAPKKYHKVRMGKVISEAIGIERIRSKCAHFNFWLKTLENLNPI